MKPTVVLDENNSLGNKFVTSLSKQVTIFQSGFTTGDKSVLEFLNKEVDLADAVDADWTTLKRSGADLQLDENNNYHVLEGPLVLRVNGNGSISSSDWQIGLYG